MTQHTRDDQAFQSAANKVLVVDGVQLGALDFTQKSMWLANDDATVTGAGYAVSFKPSADLKKAIALLKDGAVTPPVDPPPTDPNPPATGDAHNIGAIQPGDVWTPPAN